MKTNLNIRAAVHFHVNPDNTVAASCCIVNSDTSEVFGFCKTQIIENNKPNTRPGCEYIVFPNEESHIMYPVIAFIPKSSKDEPGDMFWREATEQELNHAGNIIVAEYETHWDDQVIIASPCKVNLDTHEVFDIEYVNVEGVQVLDGEFVVIDGKQYMVFEKSEYDELANAEVIRNAYWRT